MMVCWASGVPRLLDEMHRWLLVLALAWLSFAGVAQAQTAQSLFTNQTPIQVDVSDGVPYEMGMRFQLARSGQISAVRYWKAATDTGTHVGRIWSATGTVLASVTFTGETASGWQQQALDAPLAVQASTIYTVSVNVASHFPVSIGGMSSPIVNGDINSIPDGSNGVFGSPGTLPIFSYQTSNYFRDIVFAADATGPPAKLALTPLSTNVQIGNVVSYTATIQDANGNPLSLATNPISFSVTGVSGAFSPASPVSPSGGSATSTLTPSTTGTATVTASATGLTSATASVVVSDPSGLPQSLFTTQTPGIASATDGIPYELGMKFQVARSGSITAVRYWKASGDTGTHVGRMWSSTGALLASVTFSGETASGWQQQTLTNPVGVHANTIYIVSVNIGSRYPFTDSGLASSIVNGDIGSVADGSNGVYGSPLAFPTNAFRNSNYFRDVVFVPDAPGAPTHLTLIPANTSTQTGVTVSYTATIRAANGNAVTTATNPITFSVSGASGSFNPSTIETPITPTAGNATSNFTAHTAGTATITASSQGLGSASGVLVVALAPAGASKITLTPAHANTSTGVPVRYTATIQDASSNTVTTATHSILLSITGAAGSFNPPSPITASNGVVAFDLTPTTAGTATVAVAAAGLTSDTATVVVSGPSSALPHSLFTTQTPAIPSASDGVPYELGMKFQVARTGRITAIRYWKAAGDDGTHIGRIWSITGTLLTSVTFGAETASGWQQQALPTPLTVQANSTYVVSVNILNRYVSTRGGLSTFVVNGDISSVADGNNGVYGAPFALPSNSFQNSNYFRDIVYVADAVSSISKVSGDKQTGAPNSALPNALVVVVKNVNNDPLPNVPVTFVVSSGLGSVGPASVNTDANGRASATVTLGASGPTVVTAAAAGIGSATFRAGVPNAIYLENQQPGTAAWKITDPVGSTTPEIAGYAGATSVNKGGSLPLKISVAQPGSYAIDVYRLGYYAGSGGRLMGSFGPLTGVTQSPCSVTDPATLLIECNWSTSFTLTVGSNWTSGLYVANLMTLSGGKQSQIWFVVRDDSAAADIVFQASFMNHLAYNNYGDTERHSLYEYNSTNGQRAFKVSLDRPFGQVTTDSANLNNMLLHERNMARWLESQGYDVAYVSNVDIHGNPALLLQHKLYLSVGHDEYWSLEMRDGVEQARDAGVNLGFFSANTAFWRVRFEPSTTGEPNRVMVCYKDPLASDPLAPTYLWRGPENNRPENALLGVMYVGDDVVSDGYDYVVTNATDPYYSNTGLTNGAAVMALVGYEWDAVVDNGFTPPGLVVLSSSATNPTSIAPNLPPGSSASIANAVRYTTPGGTKVFSTGSIQFAWGLDSDGVVPARADPRIKQFVINVLNDMGAKPLSPDDGMIVP